MKQIHFRFSFDHSVFTISGSLAFADPSFTPEAPPGFWTPSTRWASCFLTSPLTVRSSPGSWGLFSFVSGMLAPFPALWPASLSLTVFWPESLSCSAILSPAAASFPGIRGAIELLETSLISPGELLLFGPNFVSVSGT